MSLSYLVRYIAKLPINFYHKDEVKVFGKLLFPVLLNYTNNGTIAHKVKV